MAPTSIVLVDDHPAVRRGVGALIAAERDLEIVGETGDGLEAVHLIGQLKPDVVVLDLRLPGLNGLKVLPLILDRSRRTQVVIYTMWGSRRSFPRRRRLEPSATS